jgi:hypothetical protein
MPASIDSTDNCLTLGIKYEKNKEYTHTKIGNSFKVTLPDRTLYLFRSFMPSTGRLLNIDIDEYVELDVFNNKSLLGEMGFDYAMVNSSAIPKTYLYDDYDSERKKLWPTIVADSGGFQLARGVVDFLSPLEIVNNHNKSCDAGMTLDIPMAHYLQKHFLDRAAKVNLRNNKIFEKHKRDSLELINIFHGGTFYSRDKYREIVEDDSYDRVALGGVKTLELVPLALQIVQAVTTGKKYKQYHVLGVSGLERWILLSYIGHKKIATQITSDSSSHIQSGINVQYFEPQQLVSINSIGDTARASNIYRQLHCSCPACSLVKYVKPVGDQSFSLGNKMTVSHNLFITKSYVDEIWELTKLPKKEILTSLRHIFKPAKIETISRAMSAVDVALQDSVEKSAKQFCPYLLDKYVENKSSGLYGSTVTSASKEAYARTESVILTYETFHKTGVEPKKKTK